MLTRPMVVDDDDGGDRRGAKAEAATQIWEELWWMEKGGYNGGEWRGTLARWPGSPATGVGRGDGRRERSNEGKGRRSARLEVIVAAALRLQGLGI